MDSLTFCLGRAPSTVAALAMDDGAAAAAAVDPITCIYPLPPQKQSTQVLHQSVSSTPPLTQTSNTIVSSWCSSYLLRQRVALGAAAVEARAPAELWLTGQQGLPSKPKWKAPSPSSHRSSSAAAAAAAAATTATARTATSWVQLDAGERCPAVLPGPAAGGGQQQHHLATVLSGSAGGGGPAVISVRGHTRTRTRTRAHTHAHAHAHMHARAHTLTHKNS